MGNRITIFINKRYFYIIEVDTCPWNYREIRRIDGEVVEIQPRIIFSKNKLPIVDYGTEG
jgi:hypothetical protein